MTIPGENKSAKNFQTKLKELRQENLSPLDDSRFWKLISRSRRIINTGKKEGFGDSMDNTIQIEELKNIQHQVSDAFTGKTQAHARLYKGGSK